MVTVADTSPLNYLVLIEAVEVLRPLYERISVPEAVIEELCSADAPVRVQEWAASYLLGSRCTPSPMKLSTIPDGKRYTGENELP